MTSESGGVPYRLLVSHTDVFDAFCLCSSRYLNNWNAHNSEHVFHTLRLQSRRKERGTIEKLLLLLLRRHFVPAEMVGGVKVIFLHSKLVHESGEDPGDEVG